MNSFIYDSDTSGPRLLCPHRREKGKKKYTQVIVDRYDDRLSEFCIKCYNEYCDFPNNCLDIYENVALASITPTPLFNNDLSYIVNYEVRICKLPDFKVIEKFGVESNFVFSPEDVPDCHIRSEIYEKLYYYSESCYNFFDPDNKKIKIISNIY